VPDTQEVFLYPNSGTSIIIEVLERVAADDDNEAARHVSNHFEESKALINTLPDRFHFESLAHDNSAISSTVLKVDICPTVQGETPSPIVLHGTQSVPKFNSTTPDEVHILIALYRIRSKNVDLIMSMNIPTRTVDDGAVGEDDVLAAQRDFNAAATSLKIVDFGLFA
jgi:hypothetical protein